MLLNVLPSNSRSYSSRRWRSKVSYLSWITSATGTSMLRSFYGNTSMENGLWMCSALRPSFGRRLKPTNHAKCSLNHAECSLNHAKCSLKHAECSLNHTSEKVELTLTYPLCSTGHFFVCIRLYLFACLYLFVSKRKQASFKSRCLRSLRRRLRTESNCFPCAWVGTRRRRIQGRAPAMCPRPHE
jgi:hypothetical protein